MDDPVRACSCTHVKLHRMKNTIASTVLATTGIRVEVRRASCLKSRRPGPASRSLKSCSQSFYQLKPGHRDQPVPPGLLVTRQPSDGYPGLLPIATRFDGTGGTGSPLCRFAFGARAGRRGINSGAGC
ncbi:unnamed protein product [Calypogeia fissa]